MLSAKLSFLDIRKSWCRWEKSIPTKDGQLNVDNRRVEDFMGGWKVLNRRKRFEKRIRGFKKGVKDFEKRMRDFEKRVEDPKKVKEIRSCKNRVTKFMKIIEISISYFI